MHPWLAVVAIKMRTRNARWGRSLGKRILNFRSGAVLGEGNIPESRWQYISTLAGQYSTPPDGKVSLAVVRILPPVPNLSGSLLFKGDSGVGLPLDL